MTIEQFIHKCETEMGSGKVRLTNEAKATYYQKLGRFTDEQLSSIYDKVLELTEHFPKVKNVYDAARECGFLDDVQERQYKPHVWERTDCRLCFGEGLLCVQWEREVEKTGSGMFEVFKLLHIQPYSEMPRRGGVAVVFRCKCLAGEAEGVPKGIPRWSSDQSAIRRRPFA